MVKIPFPLAHSPTPISGESAVAVVVGCTILSAISYLALREGAVEITKHPKEILQ